MLGKFIQQSREKYAGGTRRRTRFYQALKNMSPERREQFFRGITHKGMKSPDPDTGFHRLMDFSPSMVKEIHDTLNAFTPKQLGESAAMSRSPLFGSELLDSVGVHGSYPGSTYMPEVDRNRLGHATAQYQRNRMGLPSRPIRSQIHPNVAAQLIPQELDNFRFLKRHPGSASYRGGYLGSSLQGRGYRFAMPD
jgi:hypothetical protein